MKNFDEKKFKLELLKQQWECVYFHAEDPNTMWEIWKKLFSEVLDKHAPLQHKKPRSKKSFLDYKHYQDSGGSRVSQNKL